MHTPDNADPDLGARHRETWAQIVWLVNGRASEAERARAQSHLAVCADCREELAFQQQLAAGFVAAPGDVPAPDAALARFWEGVDAFDGMTAVAANPVVPASAPRVRWVPLLAAAAVLQAVGLAALVGLQWRGATDAAPYTTLSSAAVSGAPRIRLVPSPVMTLGALKALLAREHLVVVETSADGAIFGLAPDAAAASSAASVREAVRSLRATPDVLLAEPVGAAP